MILHMMIVLVLVPILRTFTISIREKVQFTTTTFTYILSPSEVDFQHNAPYSFMTVSLSDETSLIYILFLLLASRVFDVLADIFTVGLWLPVFTLSPFSCLPPPDCQERRDRSLSSHHVGNSAPSDGGDGDGVPARVCGLQVR